MRILIAAASVALAVLTQSACSPAERAPPPEENVFSDQTQMLEKARGVEDTLLEAEQERRKQIEDPDRL